MSRPIGWIAIVFAIALVALLGWPGSAPAPASAARSIPLGMKPSLPTKPSPTSPASPTTTASPATPTSPTATTSPTTPTSPQIAPAIASNVKADEEIALLLQRAIQTSGAPAMAAAVVKDGRVIGSAAVGVRKNKDATPVTLNDPFPIANCTKAFTATLIGRLVDQGKLKWETTIAETLGREIPGVHPDFAGVTVDQLLHHRGGLVARGPSEVWTEAQRAKGTPQEQRAVYVEAIITKTPAKSPGQYLYSNAGYATLGMMAEVVMGIPFEQLMKEQVFEPLGLTTAGFGLASDSKLVTAPWPHTNGSAIYTENPACIAPGSRMFISIGDWATFANFQLGHQPTPPLLKPETLAHLHALQGETADHEMGYACGWFRPLRDWTSGRSLHHIGTNSLCFSEIWLVPPRDFGVMVVTNEGNQETTEVVEHTVSALVERFLGVKTGPLESAKGSSQNKAPVIPK